VDFGRVVDIGLQRGMKLCRKTTNRDCLTSLECF
jgi:hypothetical protein